MTTICLIRHGETDWNSLGKLQGSADIPLNNIGLLQAEECREVLKTFRWDIIIASPLKRAKQTATIINSELNVPLIEMKEFTERNYGLAEGMTEKERLAAFPNRNYPNQEDRYTLNSRVIDGINKIHQLYSGQKVLLVAHGAVINTVLGHFSNGKIGSGKTKLVNGCFSNIEYAEEGWLIKNYNQISHLSNYCKEGKPPFQKQGVE
ncbi:histidine phosphatase family protein [Cytobacillus oceanisediminis]|uniref:Phosphatase n=1 Tax=Cytobacillus oceanisediminis 2691 TaxID=1196031 RepID=A0A160MFS5_9BACI|nr:histidine phosphatase family protein [Cytobacillus oceanisediminis]AND41458.1 phosphatase [Cytobacillus oceanisediminis 2691]